MPEARMLPPLAAFPEVMALMEDFVMVALVAITPSALAIEEVPVAFPEDFAFTVVLVIVLLGPTTPEAVALPPLIALPEVTELRVEFVMAIKGLLLTATALTSESVRVILFKVLIPRATVDRPLACTVLFAVMREEETTASFTE